MPQALFYPWIDIRDEGWLKTALLYWDSVRTIVPESIEDPYSTDTGRALSEAEFLVPLRVHSAMEEIEDLTDEVLAYLDSTEAAALLVGLKHDIHVEKLPSQIGRLGEIYDEKLPYEIRNLLLAFATPSVRGRHWLGVDERFADFYMTLLASRLAERVGASLLTSMPAADGLAVQARLDAQLNGLVRRGMNKHRRHWREYEGFSPRHRMPRRLAPGMLANLAIERVGIAPDTPIDRLIEFKQEYRDELAQFRTKINQLAATVEEDLPVEALRQRISNLYTDEVVPAVANLKAALDGRFIKWMSEGLLRVALLSAGSATMLVSAGLQVPTALLAGAGISLIASGTMYNVDRRESLRANPFTYLLSAERELS